jgi:hypothetical protein
MIVVEAELRSAISSDRDCNLCRVHIINGTGTLTRGNYDVVLFGRKPGRVIRTARVENWPRAAEPAWRLIQAAMESLG